MQTSLIIPNEQLFAIVWRIKLLCEESRNGETMMTFVLERLRRLVPVLKYLVQVEQPPIIDLPSSFETLLEQIYRTLRALKVTLKRVTQLNRIVYLVQAAKIHEDLVEGHLRRLSNTLLPLVGAFVAPNNFTDTNKEKDGTLYHQLSDAVTHYFQFCNAQDKQFASFQKAVRDEQVSTWLNKDLNVLEVIVQVLGDDVTTNEVLLGQRKLQQDLEVVSSQLLVSSSSSTTTNTNTNTNKNPMARSKLIEHEIYWTAMVDRLADAMPCDNLFPEWALDPVTKRVMMDPVIVRADCQHAVSKRTLEQWLSQGHKTCPVCQSTLKALYGTPDKQLLRRIQSLAQETTTTDGITSTIKGGNLEDDSDRYADSFAGSNHSIDGLLMDDSSQSYARRLSVIDNMEDSWADLRDIFLQAVAASKHNKNSALHQDSEHSQAGNQPGSLASSSFHSDLNQSSTHTAYTTSSSPTARPRQPKKKQDPLMAGGGSLHSSLNRYYHHHPRERQFYQNPYQQKLNRQDEPSPPQQRHNGSLTGRTNSSSHRRLFGSSSSKDVLEGGGSLHSSSSHSAVKTLVALAPSSSTTPLRRTSSFGSSGRRLGSSGNSGGGMGRFISEQFLGR